MIKSKELTKQQLIDWNIYIDENNDFWRTSKTGELKYKMKIHDLCTTHKYGKDNIYKAISFSYNNTAHTVLVQRAIFAWYNGKARAGYVIDHKDGKPFNNDINNLEEITQAQNNKKKKGHHNDSIYYGMNGWTDEQVDAYQEAKRQEKIERKQKALERKKKSCVKKQYIIMLKQKLAEQKAIKNDLIRQHSQLVSEWRDLSAKYDNLLRFKYVDKDYLDNRNKYMNKKLDLEYYIEVAKDNIIKTREQLKKSLNPVKQ